MRSRSRDAKTGDYFVPIPNHGSGEYACDEDGDGFHEVHVNTTEGFPAVPVRKKT